MANLAIFGGNLYADAEKKEVNGDPVVEFRFALRSGYGDNEKTTPINASYWTDRHAALMPHLLKGAPVTVAGSIKLETFQKGDGSQDSVVKFHVAQLELSSCATNSLTVSGNLTDDARGQDLRTKSEHVTNFRVACNTGTRQKEHTTFFQASVFGALSKAVLNAGKLTKGSRVVVEGEFYLDAYEDRNAPGTYRKQPAVLVRKINSPPRRDSRPEPEPRSSSRTDSRPLPDSRAGSRSAPDVRTDSRAGSRPAQDNHTGARPAPASRPNTHSNASPQQGSRAFVPPLTPAEQPASRCDERPVQILTNHKPDALGLFHWIPMFRALVFLFALIPIQAIAKTAYPIDVEIRTSGVTKTIVATNSGPLDVRLYLWLDDYENMSTDQDWPFTASVPSYAQQEIAILRPLDPRKPMLVSPKWQLLERESESRLFSKPPESVEIRLPIGIGEVATVVGGDQASGEVVLKVARFASIVAPLDSTLVDITQPDNDNTRTIVLDCETFRMVLSGVDATRGIGSTFGDRVRRGEALAIAKGENSNLSVTVVAKNSERDVPIKLGFFGSPRLNLGEQYTVDSAGNVIVKPTKPTTARVLSEHPSKPPMAFDARSSTKDSSTAGSLWVLLLFVPGALLLAFLQRPKRNRSQELANETSNPTTQTTKPKQPETSND